MKTRTCVMGWVLMMVLAGILPARANDIAVSNIGWAPADGGESYVTFNLSWSNSWRAAWEELAANNVSGSDLPVKNWDTAWVFVKYRPTGNTDGYAHATLSTNATDHVIPAAAGGVAMTNAVGLTATRKANDNTTPGEGVGVFIYRADSGHGHIDMTNVKLRWLHGADGVVNTNSVDLQVHAIEMVYVDQGPFHAGNTNGVINHSIRATDNANSPFLVNTDAQFDISYSTGPTTVTISNNFPSGYSAFYCMKYSITQGQYAEFLNAIGTAASDRYSATHLNLNRYAITNAAGTYTTTNAYVACNYLSWADGAVYAAWAGLRPMTELEYEKACRGPLNAVAGEFAWRGTTGTAATGITNPGAADEKASNTGANAVWNNSGTAGPLRVGVFAGAGTTRAAAGASYWGIMELTGNLWERAVTIGNANGRAFTGAHGFGTLTVPAGWPAVIGASDADGAGLRGGEWADASDRARVSDRINAAVVLATRGNNRGSRAVRSVASGVDP